MDATKLGGPDDNRFGVIWGRDVTIFGFEISSAGSAWIYKNVNGVVTGLSSDKLKKFEGINPEGVINHMVAVCSQDLMELYVNERLVASTDYHTTDEGIVVLFVGNQPDFTGADILIDNFFIYSSGSLF